MQEPLMSQPRHSKPRIAWLVSVSFVLGIASTLLLGHMWTGVQDSGTPGITTVANPNDYLHHRYLDIAGIRNAAKKFVDSLSAAGRKRLYYPDPSLQEKQWELCTIVQQCLTPKYGLAMGDMTPLSRGLFFNVLAKTLSDEGYKRLMVQQLSNLLLGEMQDWAVHCDGECAEMNDPSGQLPIHKFDDPPHRVLDVSKQTCMDYANKEGRHMLWVCKESPRMIHHGNINTSSGRYFLGNIFNEPMIHARNDHFDFVEVYGSLEEGAPFGFRFSGHHYDISFRFYTNGTVDDYPVFIGHNPLVVPLKSPPPPTEGPFSRHFYQWRNMAGIDQFPDVVARLLLVSDQLTVNEYVPLNQFDSTPETGGLTLKNGKTIEDVAHLKLDSIPMERFETIWALVHYTLECARGVRSYDYEREQFHREGRMLWTTFVNPDSSKADITKHLPRDMMEMRSSRSFLYIQVETDEFLYFALMNTLFTLVVENEPSNHLHSIVIRKSQLKAWTNKHGR
jgi:hypothetical protein